MGNLTTRDTVKTELGISDNSLDVWLDTVIKQESAKIESYCRRNFERRTVTDTFRQETRVQTLQLSVWPVASVTSVTEGTDTLAPADYEIDEEAGLLHRLDDNDAYYTWAADKIVVQYEAGYVLPGNAGADLPADIEAACIELCKLRYHGQSRDPALRSESVDGVYDVSYRDSVARGMPDHVADMLAPYRSWIAP